MTLSHVKTPELKKIVGMLDTTEYEKTIHKRPSSFLQKSLDFSFFFLAGYRMIALQQC